jgi:hypothetical protein
MSPKDPLAAGFELSDIQFAARPDTIDFRDLMYIPTLVEVPRAIPLENYQQFGVPILDQGREGACTGFGLATVANFLLLTREPLAEMQRVSPRMLYEMARRYDEWPGEAYSGSSARGAMKGWHKHGVCSENAWKYVFNKPDTNLTPERAAEAAARPLGAYFRVNHKDLVSMHCAIAEVGILYASAKVHEGWAPSRIALDGSIPYEPGFKITGGHAFAIVAYDEQGLWVQNSWSNRWGKAGYGRISYDDWLANGTDVWVARLGVPVRLATQNRGASATGSTAPTTSTSYVELRPHIISLGNNGALKPDGQYGTCEDDVATIILQDIPRITQGWKKKRIFLYAHGGLVPETVFLQRIADYRATMLDQEVYPLGFVWHSDFWSTATNIVKDAFSQVRPEGALDNALDFLLDRLDDSLERLVRKVQTRAFWDEMKENAIRATTNPKGGARLVLKQLVKLAAEYPEVEFHLGGHSAGSIFMAPLAQFLATKGKVTSGPLKGSTGLGLPVTSCTLWAPGITIEDFDATYLPILQSGRIERFALYTLTDEAERADNVGKIYNKSLLYLVANALEDTVEKPLLGLARDVERHAPLQEIFRKSTHTWIQAPTEDDAPHGLASEATSHGAFDDDPVTVKSTLLRMLDTTDSPAQFRFARSSASLRNRRKQLDSLPR